MATMDYTIQTDDNPRGRWPTLLLVMNWGVFAFVAVSALSWLAVILMVIPYPELMAKAGETADIAFENSAYFCVLSLLSGAALALLMRRHAWQWFGQIGFVLTAVALLVRVAMPYI